MNNEKIAAEYNDGNALSYRQDSSLDTPFNDNDEYDKTLREPADGHTVTSPSAQREQVTGTISQAVDIPWKYRIPAFCLILLWGTGASFADVTIGPLKSTLVKQLGINSEWCSLIQCAVDSEAHDQIPNLAPSTPH